MASGWRRSLSPMSTVWSVPRAPRFAFDVPVRVRFMGTGPWAYGRILNISRSGLLMAIRDSSLSCSESIEAIVRLSEAAESVGDVAVRGRVVRVAHVGQVTQLATTINEYRLHRSNAIDRVTIGCPPPADRV